jgi:tRNA (guanine-N7-)-methyltransferase
VASPGSGPISPTSSSAPSTEPSIEHSYEPDSTGAEPTARPRRVLYGRRSGPGLGRKAKQRLERLLPELGLNLPESGDLVPAALFTPPRERLWLEIGFGGGEHLAWQAAANPEVGLIGVEPFLDGVARLLRAIETDGLSNIRLFTDDARLLLDRLPQASLQRIFVLFADPWPKRRHWKRRIINARTVTRITDLLEDGGELRVATDDPGYRRWILAHLLAEPRLDWQVAGPEDWRTRPADWPPTRYEEKALAAGRRPAFLRFLRRPRTEKLASGGI